MRTRVTVAAVALVLGGSLATPVEAHTTWKVTGTLKVGALLGKGFGCITNPICAGFETGCQAPVWDQDLGFSFRRLPANLGGHKASFTWTAGSPPIDPAGGAPFVQLMHFRSNLPQSPLVGVCYEISVGGRYINTNSTFIITIPSSAAWIGVSATAARDLNWTLQGVAH